MLHFIWLMNFTYLGWRFCRKQKESEVGGREEAHYIQLSIMSMLLSAIVLGDAVGGSTIEWLQAFCRKLGS